jgi:predicted adenine nucleotide alpha hydrolase (AANH) superfamily ATPase
MRGFRAFTSTLLVSPYQDHAVLKAVGRELSDNTNVHFYYKDFRPSFRTEHQEAHESGMYCQNYCGCAFSMVERCEKRGQGR